MGFCYGTNYRTGHSALACDFCGASDGKTRKVRCPYGYCQSWASCPQPECRAKARGRSSIGVVNADGTPNREAGIRHAHCKERRDQEAQERTTLAGGGLEVIISSGRWHASKCVHGLYYVIAPQSYAWIDVLGKGVWHEKDELIAKLEALGHRVKLVSDEEAERIVNEQRQRFLFSDGSDKPARSLNEIIG